MTVNYNLLVSNSSPWSLIKIVLRWKGSLWKAVWVEYLVWLALFFVVSFIYRFALGPDQKKIFIHVSRYIDSKIAYIPLDFMLGFFVSVVVNRWGIIFNNIGILDNVSLMTAAHIKGTTIEARMIRRNIVRYCVLSQTIVFRDISMQVRTRFPTLDTVVVGRIMLPHEKDRFESVQDGYAKHWMPFQWAMSLANYARRKGYIDSEIRVDSLISEIKAFRTQMATLRNYDWVPLPIMYPQLVFLAVHTYFFLACISRQFVDESDIIDIYFPIMSSLQFIFYIGWMKVAEALMNPMGEDDDDFECNWLIDRNLRIGLTIVDEGFESTPDLLKDEFWGSIDTQPLYAAGSRHVNACEGSLANVDLVKDGLKEVEMFPLGEPDEVFGSSLSPTVRRLSVASPSRRVSVIKDRNDRRNSSLDSAGMFGNLRRRMSRINSKPSSASLGEIEKAAYTNDIDDVSVDLAVPSDVPRRIVFEDSNGDSIRFDESMRRDNRRLRSEEDISFAASHSVINPHQVVSDTITEADEVEGMNSLSRNSSQSEQMNDDSDSNSSVPTITKKL